MNEISKKIRQWRKEKNMTQEDLASALGVSSQAVSKWETGQSMPDITLIMPLCNVLSKSVDTLLGGKRNDELNEKFHEYLRFGHYGTLSVDEEALEEFPNDKSWLTRAAHDNYFIGMDLPEDDPRRERHLRRAIFYYRKVKDIDPEENFDFYLSQIDFALGRKEQALAVAYKMKFWDSNRDYLLQQFLEGDKLKKHKQDVLWKKMQDAFIELMAYNTEESIALAEKIYALYCGNHTAHFSWPAAKKMAGLCLKKNDADGYRENMIRTYRMATEADRNKAIPYSSPLMDSLELYDPKVTELEQFLSSDLSHPCLEELRKTMVGDHFKLTPCQGGRATSAYVHFFKNKAHLDQPDLVDLSTSFDTDEERAAAFKSHCNEMLRKKRSFDLFTETAIAAYELMKEEKLKGYFGCLGVTPFCFCNCKEKEKYVYLGIPEAERAKPTAEDGAKIFSIVDIVTATGFENSGLEEKVIDAVCREAKAAGFDYIEVYPTDRDAFNKDEYDRRTALFASCGFTVVRDLSTSEYRQTVWQKAL